MRILFLTQYDRQGASSRLMNYDYLKYYERAGFECVVSPLLGARYFQFRLLARATTAKDILSHPAYYAQRLYARLRSLPRASRFDVIVLEREVLPYVPFGLEAWLKRQQANLVCMYDDATHIYYRHHPNRLVRMLCRDKIGRIMSISSRVVVYNEVLAEYARHFNEHVHLLTAGLDLAHYHRKDYTRGEKFAGKAVVIGWIGTPGGFDYLRMLEPVFAALAKRYDIELCVISSDDYRSTNVRVRNKSWSLGTEAEELRALDIGIMPLPDSEWTRGKSGCKALQYMASAVPAVVSPIGINARIVEHGVNGLLASGRDEWERSLSTLIEDADLRKRLGEAGRALVESSYTEEQNAARLVSIMRGLVDPEG
jgi:glycosyltransferase involved in cell wall biosynthesis